MKQPRLMVTDQVYYLHEGKWYLGTLSYANHRQSIYQVAGQAGYFTREEIRGLFEPPPDKTDKT